MATDLRITKSETAIEHAFLDLIEEKGFSNVHIVDIATRANVNRNTIYLRYGSKEDIIASILNKAYQKELSMLDLDKILKTKSNRRAIEAMFTTIFTILAEENDLYRIILTDQNLSGYIDKLLNDIRKLMMSDLEDTKKNRVVVEYILQGVYGVVRMWIIYDIGTIEENVKVVSDLVFSNVKRFAIKQRRSL